jgi:hypothetical protein
VLEQEAKDMFNKLIQSTHRKYEDDQRKIQSMFYHPS